MPLTVELRKSRWEHVLTKPPPSIALRAGPWWSLRAAKPVTPAQAASGQTRSFTVAVANWPRITSGTNARYAFLDQGARSLAAKPAEDAKQRGDVKY